MTSQKEINIIISNEENLNSVNKDKIENSSILSPKKTLEIKSIIETSPEVKSHFIRNETLSPQNIIDSEKMELNNKNFPSKELFLKRENSEKISYNIKSHSPIVNYYAGLDHTYYSPDNYSFNNKGDLIFKFYNNTNNDIFNNFSSYSPNSIFNKKPNLNVFDNNQLNVKSSLQERIENNSEKNNIIKETSRKNSFNEDEDSNQNQELYMLSFNSDDDEKENENEDKKKENKNIISMPYIPKNYNNNYMPNKFDEYSNMKYFIPKENYNDNENNKFAFNREENLSLNKIKNNEDKNKIKTINQNDTITITLNNKKVKRIDPKKYMDESYEFLSHNIFPLSKDQGGCRFLQKKLEDDPLTSIKYFYPAILPYLIPLIKDSFGNYLIQKIFSYINENQIKEIITIISNNILDIGSNSHGTRVIQFLISFLSTNDLSNYFYNIIKPHIIPLLKELNGTHIIQKFVNDFPQYQNLIDDIIISNCSSLSMHRHGCCVLQKFLESINGEKKDKLINSLLNDCENLIINQFGNYVIQSILLLNEINYSNIIVEIIIKNPSFYSKHKYSSNVVEKSFDYCDDEIRKKLIQILSEKNIVCDLILDAHGNYVIQKALSCADKDLQDIIIDNLKSVFTKLKNVSFGERIINRLSNLYPQLNDYFYLKKDYNKRFNKKKENNYYDNNYYDNNNYYYKSNK